MTSQDIRNQFIQFFRERDHKFVRSAGVVPFDDPTLLFTNAGMNQFKGVFLGTETPDNVRIVNSQKCIRVSGKHNDLEEVGRDTYHHTFFEMLGNWSFGDYYKEEAIKWAWELFTEIWKIPKERLYATVYEDDDEAFELWKSVTDIPHNHVLRFGAKDNFWEMGDTGPCGPCSELHIDLGGDEAIDGSHPDYGVNTDNSRFIELWNLVFIQYNRDADGNLTELAEKHVDTGAGLERIVAYLQGKDSNYDTDLFTPIIQEISALTGASYDSGEAGTPHRVIADHIRMLTFSIADGALPANDGRGYVLRRILRRAARFGRNLGMNEPFIYKLVPEVVNIMGEFYPELNERMPFIQRVIKSEEESFGQTLDRGLQIFDKMLAELEKKGEKTLTAEYAFKLYDTYGFPVDLTHLMAEEKGFQTDLKGFEKLMEKQREKARNNGRFKHSGKTEGEWQTFHDGNHSQFFGYTHTVLEAKIVKYRETENSTLVVLDKTPFYAESGGQVGDTGTIRNVNMQLTVLNTVKAGGDIIHEVRLDSGTINGEMVMAEIDISRRNAIKRNHSATHLLHAALRKVIGSHIKQSGSMVNEEHLRFDFNHFEKLTREELDHIEAMVNQEIRRNISTTIRTMSFDEARHSGALAFFGEKYGDEVRTVKFGDFSHELCGGSHVEATGEIGFFRINSESAIASGVRRIEAVTGRTAETYARKEKNIVEDARKLLSIEGDQLLPRLQNLLEEKKSLEKRIRALQFQAASAHLRQLSEKAREIDGIKIVSSIVNAASMEELKDYGTELLSQLESGVGVLGSVIDDAPYVVCVVSKDIIAQKKLRAGDIVRELGQQLGGGGGGKPHLATAGGKDRSRLQQVIEGVYKMIGEKLA